MRPFHLTYMFWGQNFVPLTEHFQNIGNVTHAKLSLQHVPAKCPNCLQLDFGVGGWVYGWWVGWCVIRCAILDQIVLHFVNLYQISCLKHDQCTLLADLCSLRTPVNSSPSKPSQPVASTWFEPETTSSLQNVNKFNEGVVCSLYHILFQCSNESSGLVNYLMAIVSRYVKLHPSDNILRLLGHWGLGRGRLRFEAVRALRKDKGAMSMTKCVAKRSYVHMLLYEECGPSISWFCPSWCIAK